MKKQYIIGEIIFSSLVFISLIFFITASLISIFNIDMDGYWIGDMYTRFLISLILGVFFMLTSTIGTLVYSSIIVHNSKKLIKNKGLFLSTGIVGIVGSCLFLGLGLLLIVFIFFVYLTIPLLIITFILSIILFAKFKNSFDEKGFLDQSFYMNLN